MTRWLTTAAALAALAAPAVAQLSAQKPSYVVIRVKLSDSGTTPGTPGGGDDGGPKYGGYGGGGQVQPGPKGPGGSGQPGFPGGGVKPPQDGGGGAQQNERSVHVLVPFEKIYKERLYPKKGLSENNPEYVEIKHPFGTSLLYPNKVNIQVDFQPFPTEEYRLEQEFKKWNAAANRKPSVLLGYIGDALKAEQLALAERFSDSLVSQFEKEKDLSADVTAYIKGYTALKGKFAEPLPTNPAADTWKAKLGSDAAVYADSPHYAIVHFSGDGLTGAAGDSVTQTAELLEKNFKSFYLWHLREGFTLPMPDKKLVVVVTKNGGQLSKLREGLDGLAVSSDSFYSPVHNLTVISPERTDELGRTFNSVAATKLEGFDRKDLLAGKHPPLKDKQKPEEIALASTYALVRKALEDEGLRSAVSREGSRQLFVSLGFVPQHVRLPKWVESGIGSLLQHPKGGGVVEVSKDTPGIVVGLMTGHGAANYELLQQFQTFFPAKKDGKENKSIDAAAVLMNVLTDKYFDATASGIDPDRKISLTDPMPGLPGGGVKPGGDGQPPRNGGIVPPGHGGTTPPPGGGQQESPKPPKNGASPPPLIPGGGGKPPEEAQGPPPGSGPVFPGGGRPRPGSPVPPGGGDSGPSVPGDGIIDPNVSNPPLSPAELDEKAKATAWALTFYVTKNGKMSKLHSYLSKLNDLPRDMRVDRNVSLKLFCESFGLLKPGTQEVDKEAFEAFAKDWMTFTQQQTPTYETIPLKKFAAPETGNQPGGGGPKPPVGPGGPGTGGSGPGGSGS